jgi:hypothetical protein
LGFLLCHLSSLLRCALGGLLRYTLGLLRCALGGLLIWTESHKALQLIRQDSGVWPLVAPQWATISLTANWLGGSTVSVSSL